MQATPLRACDGSGLGPEGEDEPDPGLNEEAGTLVERGLTLKDFQILVDKRVVKEAEDALAVVHDIPETMADSTLYASVSTGAVPSAADTDRVFTKWHEQVQLSVAAGVEMPAAWHAVSTRKWQRFCRCIHVSPSLVFVHWIDATQQRKKKNIECLNLFGREVRVLDRRFV